MFTIGKWMEGFDWRRYSWIGIYAVCSPGCFFVLGVAIFCETLLGFCTGTEVLPMWYFTALRRTAEFFNIAFAQKIGNGRGARVTAVSTLLCSATFLRRLLLRYFITFVKLDLVHCGSTIPVWRRQRWREYFDVSGRKLQETGENCIMKNFVNCPCTVLVGWTK